MSEENIEGEIEEVAQEETETTQSTEDEVEEPLQTEEAEISEDTDEEEATDPVEEVETTETDSEDDEIIEAEPEEAEIIEESEEEKVEELEIEEELEEETETAVEDEEEITEAKEEEVDVSEEDVEADVDLGIPAIPLPGESTDEPDDDQIDLADELSEMDDIEVEDHTFEVEEVKEPKKKKKKRKRTGPSFWIGLAVGMVIAVTAEILFTIPYWRNGASSPDLYYIELVVILIALMIPGLASRSIQRGLIGALLIFTVTFALPFVTMLFNWPILNPLTPLFASTDFALDAYAVFQSLFNLQFNFASIQKWIWIIDLVLMFILMVIVVTIAAALTKNIAKPKKKVGNWIGIPLLSIGLIIFAVFTPILFSSTYGIIQASTAFLAGSSQVSTAFTSFEDITQNPEILGENIQPQLEDAGYWFNISQVNYQGLRNIGVINFAVLVSGQYGPLIEAGDQLALATLSFTHVLYPLFSGIYQLTSSINNATGDMANFGQSGDASLYIDNPNPYYTTDAVNNTEELRISIRRAIDGMEAAQADLNDVLETLETADVSGSFTEIEEALAGLDLSKFPAKVSDVITQIQTKLDEFKGHLDGLQSFVSFANESLTPTKNILWVAYYSLVGNDYLQSYNFDDAYEAYDNATIKIDEIVTGGGITDFDPGTLGDIFAIDITDDFSLLLNDLLGLMDPLLNEQKAFASTFIGISNILGIFEAEGNNINLVTYTPGTMTPILADGATTDDFGFLADLAADQFRIKLEANEYGDFFNDIGANFEQTLIGDFKPREFGLYTHLMANATNYLWEGCRLYAQPDVVAARAELNLAEDILVTDIMGTLDTDLIPDYFEDYLAAWETALTAISNAMDISDDPGITAALGTLQTAVQEVV